MIHSRAPLGIDVSLVTSALGRGRSCAGLIEVFFNARDSVRIDADKTVARLSLWAQTMILFCMAQKIILASIGSLGDLHPFIAIAQDLQARGHAVILAVSEDQVEKVRSAGLLAHPILPTSDAMNQTLEMSSAEVTQKMMDDLNFVVENVMLRFLNHGVAALDEIAADAQAIVGTIMTLPAAIIAEKHAIPYVSAALQPMTLPTVYDAPRTPEYWMLASQNQGKLGRVWNRLWMPIIRAETKRRFAKPINAVRQDFGLPPLKRAPLLELEVDPVATLALYSQHFAPLQPDHPETTSQTGFAMFDSQTGMPHPLDDDIQSFLEAGAPPIVFSLGSFAVNLSGDFYRLSHAIAERLGERAILLTGSASSLASNANILVREYAPYSQLFPKSKLIVHHGGVGTTAQAMQAGVPQLIVPHLGDQWDNGARITSLGLGGTLPVKSYTVDTACDLIRDLLSDSVLSANAIRVASALREERGAKLAADAIEAAL